MHTLPLVRKKTPKFWPGQTSQQVAKFSLWSENVLSVYYVFFLILYIGMPHFIVFHFIALYRCCAFYKLKARPSNSKKTTTHFIVLLYCGGLGPNLQYLWGAPVEAPLSRHYFHSLASLPLFSESYLCLGKPSLYPVYWNLTYHYSLLHIPHPSWSFSSSSQPDIFPTNFESSLLWLIF